MYSFLSEIGGSATAGEKGFDESGMFSQWGICLPALGQIYSSWKRPASRDGLSWIALVFVDHEST
jgi:hypothetical protein